MVGDGFGGREWYQPTNYTVGSYSAFSICTNTTLGNNQLFGWGDNSHNTLSILPTNTPTLIPNMINTSFISSGYQTGAIKCDSTGWAWGNKVFGLPFQVITDAKFVSAGMRNVSFVKYDGTVWSVGSHGINFGSGSPTNTNTFIPVQMLNINNAVRVSNNEKASIILLSDSTLMSVGDGNGGELGLGTTISQTLTPLPITSLPKIIDIKSNKEGTIALTDSGNVYYWGNIFGIISTPIMLPNLKEIIAISGTDDGSHFLMLDKFKNCYAYGKNLYGQCGMSSTLNTFINTPTIVDSNVIDIMAGEDFSYIVKSDYSLWCSGRSSNPTGSIWLNLPPIQRDAFTMVSPNQVINGCIVSTVSCNKITNNPNYNDSTSVIDSVYFPNVFTPNGDGNNDNFYFPNWGISGLKCEIYNRWGLKIHEWHTINGFWDGRTTSGKECPDGVYYYIVSYRKITSENWEKHTGYISLLR